MKEKSFNQLAMGNKQLAATLLKIVVIVCLVVGLLFVLSRVFQGAWVLTQSFSLGPLTVHYYGITMALAIGAGWWLALQRASRFGITTVQADFLLQWLVFGGFVGARLYHVASSWQYYWQHPLDVFKVWHGGLSIFGALLGGFLVLIFYTIALFRKNHGSGFYGTLLHMTDWLAASVVLGQIIGRFGNFFNYEAFGYQTNVPWKMYVPIQFRPEQLAQSGFFHPLFLYEALGNLLVLWVLLLLSRRKNLPTGSLFFLYLFLYNTLRFVIEFWRVDSTFIWGFVRLNSLSSGLLCLVGITGLVLSSVASRKPTFPNQLKN